MIDPSIINAAGVSSKTGIFMLEESEISYGDSAKMAAAQEILTKIFGFSQFRRGQREALQEIFAGRDVLAVMPTGAGKSLLYQLPACIAQAGPVIVVSPLIALMRDQVAQLTARGVCAVALHSALDAKEHARAKNLLNARAARLIYLSPERLAIELEQGDILALRPSLLAVDEAHCVSIWGHDFRPDYAQIGSFARAIGEPPLLALTATAAPRTRADVIAKLFSRPPREITQSYRRDNIFISMRPRLSVVADALSVARAHRGQAGIFYCRTRAGANALAQKLVHAGLPALPYHAGMDDFSRAACQDEFQNSSDCIVVATIAFGMGIDKANVRFVCHVDLPDSVEAYYQEIGRAGRDGAPAQAIAFARAGVIFPLARDDWGEQSSDMAAIARQWACRWQAVLSALGEPSERCGHCDNCRRARARFSPLHDGPIRWKNFLSMRMMGWINRSSSANEANEPELATPWDLERRDGPIPPLTVAMERRLRILRAKRLWIAQKYRRAPKTIASDDVLRALAALKEDDAEGACEILRDQSKIEPSALKLAECFER